LYEALAALVRDVPPKSIDGVFRLPLDRAFAVQGYGTVVSGIPLCGSARLDDEVVLLPQGVAGTIRGIEVYGRTSEVVKAGQCAALNVRGFDHRAISRGDTLTVPGYFEPRQWFACALRLLPHDRLLVKHGSNVKFHTGTTEAYASVYAVKEGQMRSGEEHLVQIRTSSPVVAGLGDRFILRTPSPVRTVGGGVIIEALAGKLKRNRPGVYEDMRERAEAVGDESRLVEYFAKTASREADLAVRAKLPLARLQLLLRDLMQRQRVLSLGPKLYMHRDTCDQTARRVLELVGEYHRQSPESPGITIEQLRLDARMANDVLDGVISLLKTDGRLVEQKGRLAASEHRPTFRDEDLRRLEAVESLFRRQAFHPPTMEELVERTGACAADLQRVLKILREHQELIQVEEGLLFHREAVDRAREILAGFIRQEGKLESVRFKYLLDTTRKFALPLLDYFDRVGVTRRVGNTRYLKN
jgi:selenocysteine-specific elongation factor